jgi:glycosyltransferase involved in cell wall biosynthesis
MRLSVIITNYNYARFLTDAIESCLGQLRLDDQLLVVDDGSSDESLAVARRYQPRLQLIAKANGGQASAWNAGFMAACGDVICLLDSDDVFLPGKCDAVRAALSESHGWCFHPLREVDRARQPLRRAVPSPMIPSPAVIAEGICSGRLPYLPTATSGMSFTRALASRLLPMPEIPGITLSDNYLKFRAVAAMPGVFLDQVLGELRLHGENHYTGTDNRRLRAGQIGINTAWHLCRTEPSLRRFARRLFIDAACELISQEGPSSWSRHPLLAQFASEQLGRWSRLELHLRATTRTLARRLGAA